MKQTAGKKILQVLIHIIAWLFFLSLLTSLVPRPPKMNPALSVVIPDLFFISFFYINYYLLVPRLFVPRKYLVFGALCTVYLVLTITVPSAISGSDYGHPSFREPPGKPSRDVPPPPQNDRIDHDFSDGGMKPPPDLQPPDQKPPLRIRLFIPEFSYTIFVFLFILTLSTTIRIMTEWQLAEKEKVKAELSLLKAQINPHFLFNTLNSIYSLAVTKDDKTPGAIELFSDLMRYVLYESSHDYIPLEKKLGYIDTYIELQKMRLPPSVRVSYEKQGETGDLAIAPLTLMPFIENAFKYGVSTEKNSFIDISIEIIRDSLIMKVRNSRSGNIAMNNGSSQLGIDNTLRRLKLLYSGRYELKIDDSLSEYSIYIKLRLK
jgi:hypothetical protein